MLPLKEKERKKILGLYIYILYHNIKDDKLYKTGQIQTRLFMYVPKLTEV